MSVGWNFTATSLRYIRSQPVIEAATGFAAIDGVRFSLSVEAGHVTAPMGGRIDMAGTSLVIPDITRRPAEAQIRLRGEASTTAVLSLLDAPPFRILRETGFGPDLAEGRARFSAEIGFPLKRQIRFEDVRFVTEGALSGLRSEKLVPGRVLRAERMSLHADNAAVEIAGPVTLDSVAADVVWRQELGPGRAGRSSVSGQVVLGPDFVRSFGIGLPEGAVQGSGFGRFRLDLSRGVAPRFSLVSDLNRLRLAIPELGWRKPANVTGRLEAAGRLGPRPAIDRLALRAAGLNASGGRVSLRADGSLDVVAFERVQLDGWLDAPVQLRGRGAGRTPLVQTTGGTVDIRRTSFATGAGGSAAPDTAAGIPIELALDRVIISEGMTLTGFEGRLDTAGGLSGSFRARMNGAAALEGRLQPSRNGTRVKVTSRDAGGVLRAAGIVEYANGGGMDLMLRPRPAPGRYDGSLVIRNTRVRDAPGLTELLAALSIVGLLEQLGGEGITFDEVKAEFRLGPEAVILTESSAVGPSLGIALDGRYDLQRGEMDMQGVISPVFFLNGLGQAVSRRGEGLFGFSFTLKGSKAAPEVQVNPLSILLPGGLRDIFRRPSAAPEPQPGGAGGGEAPGSGGG